MAKNYGGLALQHVASGLVRDAGAGGADGLQCDERVRTATRFAESAYAAADAMLAEREKRDAE